MLGLPRRRDAQIKGGAQRHGHGRCLLIWSSALPEQLVEEVAEPRLEHVHLGVRDRDTRGPVVGDGPRLKVVLRRPANAELKLAGVVIKAWRRRTDSDAPATNVSAIGARSGHAVSIAHSQGNQNGQNPRHSAPRTVGGKDRKAAAITVGRRSITTESARTSFIPSGPLAAKPQAQERR